MVAHLETCFFLLWHLEEEDHPVAAITWVPSVDPRLVVAYLHLVIFCLPAIASASLDHYTLGLSPGCLAVLQSSEKVCLVHSDLTVPRTGK